MAKVLLAAAAIGGLVFLSVLADAPRRILCRVVPVCAPGAQLSASDHSVEWLHFDKHRPALRLTIPRPYITFYIKPTKNEPTEFLELSTRLPELEPRILFVPAKASSSSGNSTSQSKADTFDVMLRSDASIGHKRLSQDVGTKQWARLYSSYIRRPDKLGMRHYVEARAKQCVRRDLVEADPTFRDDLKLIAASTTDKYVCWPEGNEIFAYDGGSVDEDAVIRCGALFESVNFGPKCVAAINYNGWKVEFRFPGYQLEKWREFDAGTRRLLRSLSVRSATDKR
jgi:hypothetical protein